MLISNVSRIAHPKFCDCELTIVRVDAYRSPSTDAERLFPLLTGFKTVFVPQCGHVMLFPASSSGAYTDRSQKEQEKAALLPNKRITPRYMIETILPDFRRGDIGEQTTVPRLPTKRAALHRGGLSPEDAGGNL